MIATSPFLVRLISRVAYPRRLKLTLRLLYSAGEVVADGTDFRNGGHLRYKADILVPCGGRPESVNVNNVSKLWDAEGVTNFKYIVEGGESRFFVTGILVSWTDDIVRSGRFLSQLVRYPERTSAA
jgi:hypothetical protein